MNAVLAKEEYNTVWEEVKAFAVRMGRRPRILVAKMGQDGMCALYCAVLCYDMSCHVMSANYPYLVSQHMLLFYSNSVLVCCIVFLYLKYVIFKRQVQ